MVPVWFGVTPSTSTKHNALFFVHFAYQRQSTSTFFLHWFGTVPKWTHIINHCFKLVRQAFLWLHTACVQFYFCESGNKYKLFVSVF